MITVGNIKAEVLLKIEGMEGTYSVGHIEEVNEEYYFKVYCIMNDKDTTTLQKLITQLNIYKPAHLGYAIYLGYSWNGKIHWNGEATFSTATIVSKKGVMTNG